MRRLAILGLLALAACNENTGWNPNYVMNLGPYGDYQRSRELALTGQGPASKVIPVQLPAKAPTAAEITGTTAKAQPVTAENNLTLTRFAQSESHNLGTAVYRRPEGAGSNAERACRSYANASAAQTAFLAAGGPIVDAHGLDPDGDGFVCGWDPRPYRQTQG